MTNDELNMVINNLKKFVPMKPAEPTEENRRFDTDSCPVCGWPIRSSEFKDNYCSNCGQAIDWEQK